MRWLVEGVVLFFVHISIFIKENIQKFQTAQSCFKLVFLRKKTQGMQLLILNIMISDFFLSTFYLKINFSNVKIGLQLTPDCLWNLKII